jgi:hypothetical protein
VQRFVGNYAFSQNDSPFGEKNALIFQPTHKAWEILYLLPWNMREVLILLSA